MRAPEQTHFPMPTDVENSEAPQHSRARFELILASLLLALGLFVLPALIFWVGGTLLGPYGAGPTGGTLGSFYGDFFGDLATGSVRTWGLACGPLILVSLMRLLFLRRPSAPVEQPPQAAPRRDPRTQHERRIEPRVSLD